MFCHPSFHLAPWLLLQAQPGAKLQFPVEWSTEPLPLGVVEVAASDTGFDVCCAAKNLGADALHLPSDKVVVDCMRLAGGDVTEVDASRMTTQEVSLKTWGSGWVVLACWTEVW